MESLWGKKLLLKIGCFPAVDSQQKMNSIPPLDILCLIVLRQSFLKLRFNLKHTRISVLVIYSTNSSFYGIPDYALHVYLFLLTFLALFSFSLFNLSYSMFFYFFLLLLLSLISLFLFSWETESRWIQMRREMGGIIRSKEKVNPNQNIVYRKI